MRDQFDDRMWQAHHSQLLENLVDLAKAVGAAFDRLNRIQFDAPWKRSACPDGDCG